MNEDDWLAEMKYEWIVNHWIEFQNKQRGEEMSYSRYGYGNDYSTRSGEVAKAALEALEKGISLEQLLEKNIHVRQWWTQHIKERLAEQARAERERERRRKAAEKKALEDAKRAEVATKLTPEELALFGLTTTGKHKRK